MNKGLLFIGYWTFDAKPILNFHSMHLANELDAYKSSSEVGPIGCCPNTHSGRCPIPFSHAIKHAPLNPGFYHLQTQLLYKQIFMVFPGMVYRKLCSVQHV
ncbi:hypothetical protein T4E_10490 [Trichinella pseudospiralis]|uniref:Uncharacterized protein n=1 Tax=Trichinella pseudospiralis TaxID=6337 RepID=A0A0V0YDP2_TRIPS|nr:hypothetical protein T4E_10490 [Trichinella pseudospiralis]